MLTFDVLREYIATRSSDRWLTSWLLSSAAAVTFVAATHANSFYALSRANGAESTSELGASAWDAHADVRHIKKICNRRSDTSNKSELSFSSRFHRFIYLLRIAVPSLRSKECALLVIIIVLLATKTFLSARFARFNAALIEVAIRCDLMETTRAVMSYILWQVPSTLAGSSLKYCTEILALQLQSNLGNYFHRIYLNDNAFFPVAGSNRIKNIDERLTRHITRWSATVTKLFISLVQPLTDVVLLSYKLSALTGTRLSMLAGAYFAGFSLIACSLTPDMEKLVGEQLRREGALVSAHDRVLTYAEEIVMTQGQRYHVHVLNHLLKSLLQHKRYATYIYSRYAFVEILCLKYGSRLLGYAICGAIVLSTRTAGMTTAQLAGLHVEVTLLFIALSRAISG
ncbi:ABC transporter, putative, partial [Trypanosoma vivax Y486]